jgi:hypothetical protein
MRLKHQDPNHVKPKHAMSNPVILHSRNIWRYVNWFCFPPNTWYVSRHLRQVSWRYVVGANGVPLLLHIATSRKNA